MKYHTAILTVCTLSASALAQQPHDFSCGTNIENDTHVTAPWQPNLALNNNALRIPGPCNEDGSNIDILIIYTTNFLNGAGGLAAVQAIANQSIADLNAALTNSGIPTRAALAGLEEVNYNESGSMSTHLNNLRTPNNGILDNAHTLRDQFRADLVCLFVNDEPGDVCGIANIGVQAGFTPRPDLAFSVVQRPCMGSPQVTFAHEIGHNLGLMHDTANDPCILVGADPAAHGYIDPGSSFSTIMSAGASGIRVMRYSNPFDTINGFPAGIAGESENSLVFAQSAVAVSQFRNRDQDQDGTCDADQIAANAALDCNNNNILDQFDIDLNRNGIPDSCDIATGTSLDLDLDGVPDEAETPILRVNIAAAPGGLGTSWADAIDDLQFAFALARASGDVT